MAEDKKFDLNDVKEKVEEVAGEMAEKVESAVKTVSEKVEAVAGEGIEKIKDLLDGDKDGR